jgi:membrane-bound inhibitor of C-type lysozyme
MKSFRRAVRLVLTVAFLCAIPGACEENSPTKLHVFRCADGATVTVIFTETDDSITMRLGGRSYRLEHVEAASGAKYSDGKVVFWNKGKEAFVEIDGEMVHDGCVLTR